MQSSHAKQTVRLDVARTVLTVALVAPLVGVVWWFSPSSPQKLPMGRTEERLRVEAESLFTRLNSPAEAQACEYWAKHLYLTCRVRGDLVARMKEGLVLLGWVVASEESTAKRLDIQLSKGRDSARVECNTSSTPGECKLSLFAPR
jgi:hypothetical protein